MRKNLIAILALALVLALAALGLFVLTRSSGSEQTRDEAPAAKNEEKGDENGGGVVCIQVITPARNPESGEIREFPTPCDVPEGWEVIRNEIPEPLIDMESEPVPY